MDLPARVASRLAQASYDSIEADVEHCLLLLGRELELSLVSLTRRHGDVLVTTHQWRGIGQMDPALELDLDRAHWFRDQLEEGEDIIIDDAGALPTIASFESRFLEQRMTGALLAVPASPDRFLVAEIQRHTRVWTPAELAAVTEIAQHVGAFLAHHHEQRELVRRERRASRDSKAKSQFIATLAHELRTPLTAIIGYSQLLGAESVGPLTEKQGRFLTDILSCAEHLERIVNESLDLAKLDSGRLSLSLDEHDARVLARSAALHVKAQAEAAGIELRLELPDETVELHADDLKVQQILTNLLSNAIKFTAAGSVTLAVRSADDGVELEVRDTGAGIAPSNHERIFESFARVHRSRSSDEGTGLGLALVRRLIRLHGGDIRVASEIDEGSTFTVTLPRRAPSTNTGRPVFVGGHS